MSKTRTFFKKLGFYLIIIGVAGGTISMSWMAFQASFLGGLLVSSILGMLIGLIFYEGDFEQ